MSDGSFRNKSGAPRGIGDEKKISLCLRRRQPSPQFLAYIVINKWSTRDGGGEVVSISITLGLNCEPASSGGKGFAKPRTLANTTPAAVASGAFPGHNASEARPGVIFPGVHDARLRPADTERLIRRSGIEAAATVPGGGACSLVRSSGANADSRNLLTNKARRTNTPAKISTSPTRGS